MGYIDIHSGKAAIHIQINKHDFEKMFLFTTDIFQCGICTDFHIVFPRINKKNDVIIIVNNSRMFK